MLTRKRKLLYVLLSACMLCAMAGMTSCAGDDEELQETVIDSDLLVGKWKNNAVPTEFWRYRDDGTGVWWDEADDVTEEMASTGNRSGAFSWTFDENTGLMRYFWMETEDAYANPHTGDPVIIEELTSTRLTYKSQTGSRSSFTREP